MARHLLLQGADPKISSRADRGAQPIHLAAKRGQPELLQLLLQHSDIEALDYFKRSPLFWAVDAGQLEAVMLLLEAGANPNAQDRIGKTVLMSAVNQRQPQLLEMLLAVGANPEYTNFKGQTLMHLAAASNPTNLQWLLDQGLSADPLNGDGQTPLMYAASRNPQRHWASIQTLVEQGAKLNVVDNNQHSLLDYSLNHNHLGLFELLLEQGLDSDKLELGQLKGKTQFLQLLLDQGRL